MVDVKEKFVDMAGIIEHLKEIGLIKESVSLESSRAKVIRWMDGPNPLPGHRPGGGRSPFYFLWSEVYAWAKTACFTPAPDNQSSAA
jgi:hypothetical protein